MSIFSPSPTLHLNDVVQRLSRRAERMEPEVQAATFVSIGGLEHSLMNEDNRVIFGRRGTGKTHVLSYIATTARRRKQIPIFIDIRTMGSNGYIYNDGTLSVSERATHLLRDFVSALHDQFMDEATRPQGVLDISKASAPLERLSASVKEVLVKESVEWTGTRKDAAEKSAGGNVEGSASPLSMSAKATASLSHKASDDSQLQITERGSVRLSISIGDAHRSLKEIVSGAGTRIWVLIDEWSTIPEVLQPYLADFIKRSLFTERLFTVQIAAIEQRSSFRLGTGAEAIGIELGSDAFADVNLDDHLVFENSPQRSIAFFRDMLYRHLIAAAPGQKLSEINSSEEFVRNGFTQQDAFRELVRACEGVPRDAINILQNAASRAQKDKISIPHIRGAAKDWYETDKATYVNSNPDGLALLQWLIDRVLSGRKARGFLVRSDVRHPILDRLFDERILHIAKKSYSAKEESGVRYKVWKLDYGCYVDLMNTSRAPSGFLVENKEDSFLDLADVPEDDLRAIRRAVVDLSEFDRDMAKATTQTA